MGYFEPDGEGDSEGGAQPLPELLRRLSSTWRASATAVVPEQRNRRA